MSSEAARLTGLTGSGGAGLSGANLAGGIGGAGDVEDGDVGDGGGARRLVVPFGLLLLTLLSTTVVGAMQQLGPGDRLLDLFVPAAGRAPLLWSGLRFSLPLCAILVCHEAGHYVVARWHGVPVSLPYFIPFPLPPFGTMGAIIGLRGEVRSRNALCDIAAAGPLCGLLLAVPLLALGIAWSPVGPVASGDQIEGQSLLYLGLKLLLKGHLLPGVLGGKLVDVQLHPTAFAGWVGLFITMINLLPIGQLDGGRLAAAYFGRDHERRSWRVYFTLPLLAASAGVLVAWLTVASQHGLAVRLATPLTRGTVLAEAVHGAVPWLVWMGALLLLRRFSGGRWHPDVDPAPLSPGRRWLCAGIALVLVLIFMPYFFRGAP